MRSPFESYRVFSGTPPGPPIMPHPPAPPIIPGPIMPGPHVQGPKPAPRNDKPRTPMTIRMIPIVADLFITAPYYLFLFEMPCVCLHRSQGQGRGPLDPLPFGDYLPAALARSFSA